MSTTQLYVEFIVIGLETLCWIILLFFITIGKSMISFLKYCTSNLLSSIVVVGICYILGLVMDRISDNIFTKRKMNIKKKYNIKAESSLIIWREYEEVAFAKFTLSRIRILRGTIFNSIFIALFGSYLVHTQYENDVLAVLILVLFMGIAWASNYSHKELLENYYRKTEIFSRVKKKKSKKDRL